MLQSNGRSGERKPAPLSIELKPVSQPDVSLRAACGRAKALTTRIYPDVRSNSCRMSVVIRPAGDNISFMIEK